MTDDHDWYAKYRREVEAEYELRKIREWPEEMRKKLIQQWALFTAQQNTRLP